MTKSRTHVAKITGTESYFTLGDLRWFVKQAEAGKDDLKVTVKVYKGDVREPGTSYLSVSIPIPETPVGSGETWIGEYGTGT